MPHSSGGGSHGGGSHGGSSHGGSGSSTSHAASYFKGAHHYAYYKNGRVHHFYNKELITPETVEKNKKRFAKARKIWACVLAVFVLLISSAALFEHANKPTARYKEHDIIIDDRLGVMEDTEELMDVLEEFQNKSNVTPYILTIPNRNWKNHYASLEKYAYDTYLNLFDDEMHWLIVYSEDGAEWNDWYWEGMQGDDTDPVLTSYNTDMFTKTLHKYISKPEYTLDEALIQSFEELNAKMYDTHSSIANLIAGLVGIGLYFGFIYLILWAIMGQHLNTDAISFELPEPDKKYLEDTCQYCGGMFIHGIHISCPHCAAPLPPAEGLVYVDSPKKLQM